MEWWQRDRPGVLDPARHLLNQTWGAHLAPAQLPTKEIIATADGYQLRYLMWWDEREVSRVWWLMDLGWSHPAAGDQGADCFSGQGAPARCWGAQFTGLTLTGICTPHLTVHSGVGWPCECRLARNWRGKRLYHPNRAVSLFPVRYKCLSWKGAWLEDIRI